MDSHNRGKALETIGCAYDRVDCGRMATGVGELIKEEPLLITVAGRTVATLMCTPGDEIPLALGYLLTEGIIRSMSDIGAIGFCREESGNVVRVASSIGADLLSRLDAYRIVFSSCGICGREAIQAVTSCRPPFVKQKGRLSPRAISDLERFMNFGQHYFRRTGGTHAAVLAQIEGGNIVARSAVVKEDIGRHNALDKAVGEALMRGVPFDDSFLFLSGRTSFEMVAKAARAGISDLAAVSAPTALAVELARQLGMLLVGFARGESAVVYSGKEALNCSAEWSPSTGEAIALRR
jgi:FdhD protein